MATPAYKTAVKQIGSTKNTAKLTQPKLKNTPVTAIKYGNTVKAKDRELMGAPSLAEKYGNIDYDRAAIERVFQDATDAEFAAKRKEYDRTAGKYYNNLASSQTAYLDAMRKANAQAVQSGANAGMQNANALSAILGMSQQSSADATQLAQDRRALEDQYAESRAKNIQEALEYANQQKLALGQLGANIYGVDAQKYVGELGYNAQIGAANTAASAEARAADQALRGTLYNADANLAGQKYASDSSFSGSRLNTLAELYGNMYNADQNLAGTKYTADSYKRSSSGGSGGSYRSTGGGGGGSGGAATGKISDNELAASLVGADPETIKRAAYLYGDAAVDNAIRRIAADSAAKKPGFGDFKVAEQKIKQKKTTPTLNPFFG